MELKYDIPQIRAASTECKTIAEEVKYNSTKLLDLNKKNYGTVKDEIDVIIKDMSTCATDTQVFLTNAVEFISNVAEYFEDMDEEIAREVKNS
ncbi:MAG: hypothetical protein IKT55_05130 [Clostridia bacterium]|nr:hypothetical protein [Clostridia bacterium]